MRVYISEITFAVSHQWEGEILLLNSLFSLEPVFSVVSSEGGTVGACSSVFFVFSARSTVCPINPAKRVCCCSDTGEQRPLRVELHSPDQFLFRNPHSVHTISDFDIKLQEIKKNSISQETSRLYSSRQIDVEVIAVSWYMIPIAFTDFLLYLKYILLHLFLRKKIIMTSINQHLCF